MKALGYVRVSTQDQAVKGLSLSAQKAKIWSYCALKDLHLAEIIEDAGVSGKDLNRPGIQRISEILASSKENGIDAIVCVKLDRFFRSTQDALETCKAFDKKGIAFHSIQESLDTQSAMGKFFFTLTAALAEMERNIIGERTSLVLQHKKANGQVYGPVPFGFRRAGDRLVPDKKERKVIDRIVKLHGEGKNYSNIAEILNGKKIKTKKGGKWSCQQIKNIILKGG